MHTTAMAAGSTYVPRRVTNATVATLLCGGLAVAAFGPYVAGPLRTEQLAVYGAAAMVLPVTWLRFRPGAGVGILVAWVIFLCVALLGVALPYAGAQPWPPGSALAEIDNLALPLVIMALVWSTVRADVAPVVLDRVGRVIVWGAALNGVVALLSTRLPLEPSLRPFWSGAEGRTTAENASDLGRLSGIFNQPAEAGVLYGVAGLLALFLYRHRSRPLLLALTAIVTGGVLTVSKVFLFGGLPIILVILLRHSGARRLVHFFVAAALGIALIQAGMFSQWTGSNYLLRRLLPDDDVSLIAFYSAGRWNEGASMTQAIGAALEASPLIGMGAGGWDIPYDSAWTETIIVAGLIGAGCYALVLVLLGRLALREADHRRRPLLLALALFIAGASLGIAPLTANRVATILWLVLALLVRAHRPRHHD